MLKIFQKDLVKINGEEDEDVKPETVIELPEGFEALKESPIDVKTGLKNSGTTEAYLGLLKIFYESVDEKTEELNRFYEEKDYKNYTIKVHALKSSARVIGAGDFGEEAQRLENAGKEEDVDYICSHHAEFIKEYAGFKDLLSAVFPEGVSDQDKPEADEELMIAVFEEIKEAAEDMSCERIDSILDEMKDYRIPEVHKGLFDKISVAASEYDYKKIVLYMSEAGCI